MIRAAHHESYSLSCKCRDIVSPMRAILLVAYRRAHALSQILESCQNSGTENIYIHIDGPRTPEALSDVEFVKEIARNFSKTSGLNVFIATHEENLGCATSLISACDEVLGQVDELIVLEDDCLPSQDFWSFADQSFQMMAHDENLGLFCGPQFAPAEIHGTNWHLSSYPFHWGWGTTAKAWSKIRTNLLTASDLSNKELRSRFERRYWNAGCKRASTGITDVWDTLFVREMIRLNLLSILPPENLIQNVGDDSLALHTSTDSPWTNYSTGPYTYQNETPKLNIAFDAWARSEYFKISWRHLLSTRASALIEKFRSKKFQSSLAERVESASINFS